MLDAETLSPAPFPLEVRRRAHQGRALHVCRGAQHERGGHSVETRRELASLRARARRRRARPGSSSAPPARGLLRFPRSSRSPTAGPAQIRRVCGELRAAAVLLRAPHPRRRREPGRMHGGARIGVPWLPLVLAVSANSPYLAGARPVSLPPAPRSSLSCRAAAHRPCSAPTVSGRPSRSACSSSGWPTSTPVSGGTSVRTRDSGRSRCACPTSRQDSWQPARLPRSVHALVRWPTARRIGGLRREPLGGLASAVRPA